MAGGLSALRLDCSLSVYALLSSLLLQLLEPGHRPAVASPRNADQLSAPRDQSTLRHRYSPLHAHRLLRGDSFPGDRLSPGMLSRFSGGQVQANVLPGGDFPAVDQLPGARLRV